MPTIPWDEVREVVDSVLDLPPHKRTSYLRYTCPKSTVRRYVQSLVLSYEQAGDFLKQPAVAYHTAAAAHFATGSATESWSGRRVGPYKILEKIGEGGMGAVYLAQRADDQYQMHVAIKLVRNGFDSSFILARFKAERQILANLDHPNIARLLDGGSTEDGQPYFVMECIQGQPLDRYCADRRLTIPERLQLFRIVCSAVQHAHQNLIIHRDIKPSNILVTSDGTPKLLDFGIAKLLEPELAGSTATQTLALMRLLTPDYASPEQLRGETITTASDVFSLGVVLYELLTGRRPKQQKNGAAEEFEAEKPSIVGSRLEQASDDVSATSKTLIGTREVSHEKLRLRLAGDVDNIVLMALRQEPHRRYASVEQLSDDIRRHLEGHPVIARADTFAYRSSKFIRRHKGGGAVAVLLTVSLMAGMVATLREAHIARNQQARAERRFNDVRKLSNSLLFDIHDAIRDLPGSTPARKILVTNALIYLDSLAEEARGDLSLQRELAEAYERVGDVQGNPRFANIGDTAGAIESYRKALRLRLALANERRSPPADRINLASIYEKLSFALGATNDFSDEFATLQSAYPIVELLEVEQKDNPDAQEVIAEVYLAMGQCLSDIGNLAGSLKYYRRSAAIREAITGGSPAFQAQVQMYLAGLYDYMGEVRYLQGNVDEALLLQTKARDTMARLAKSDPRNATFEQFHLQAEFGVGYYLSQEGLNRQALRHYQIALAGYRKLTSSDPHDVVVKRYFARCYMRIGMAHAAEGEPAEGIQSVRKSLQILEGLWATDQTDTYYKAPDIAYARSALGEAYSHLAMQPGAPEALRVANWREARSWYEKSLDIWVLLQSQAPLARWDSKQPDKIRGEIKKCDTALIALQSRH